MDFKNTLIDAMVKCMSNEYDRLYKLQAAGTVIRDFYEAMQAGDNAITSLQDLTKNITAARGDYIMSDRETAAYGYTLRAFGIINF